MKNETLETVSELHHKIRTKDANGDILIIDISLDDDCHNGHNDFSMTASCYDKKGNGSTADRYFLYGGCSHEEILKVHPELMIFEQLHLANFNGAPMYAIENGFYHLTNAPLEVARDYVHASDVEIAILLTCEDKLYFQYMLESMGIVSRWKAMADKGIATLEQWTGKKFKDNSTRIPFTPLTDEQRVEIERKLNTGYYDAGRIETRKKARIAAAKQKIYDDLKKDLDKAVEKETNEYNIKVAVLDTGLSIDNFIYYNHTNEGVFNWHTSSYNPAITKEEFENFLKVVNYEKLPLLIKFKLDKR